MSYTPTQEKAEGAVNINNDEGRDNFECSLACMASGYKDIFLGKDEDLNFVDEDLNLFYRTLNHLDI